jgi:DNA-binding GntR family transcriptional regulator
MTLAKRTRSAVPGTLLDRAYDYIRSGIEKRTFQAGDNLYDSQIATTLGMSRTPVREALRRLEREGIVASIPRRGWTVPRLRVDDLIQIFEIKESLEGMLARKAVGRMTEEVIAELESAITDLEAAAAAGDRDGWLSADRRWHRILYGAAGNERAREMISSLNSQWNRFRFWIMALEGRMGRSAAEHRAIHQQVLAGDGAAAEARMKEHLASMRADIVDLVTNLILPAASMVSGQPHRDSDQPARQSQR